MLKFAVLKPRMETELYIPVTASIQNHLKLEHNIVRAGVRRNKMNWIEQELKEQKAIALQHSRLALAGECE